MREKLIELILEIDNKIPVLCDLCAGSELLPDVAGDIADHLIANGVTVRAKGEWHTLTECSNEGVYCSVCHKKVYKADYAWCNKKNKVRSDFCPNCGADMRPDAPKDGE